MSRLDGSCKIYKVVSPNTDKIYIGSTRMSLVNRLNRHRHNKNCSSYKIVEFGEPSIELLEIFDDDDNNKKLIKEREQHYMDLYGGNCINKNKANIEFQTLKDKYKYYRDRAKAKRENEARPIVSVI